MNAKSNPSGFLKRHLNTSNNIWFCAILDFFNRFTVLVWIKLDLNTPSENDRIKVILSNLPFIHTYTEHVWTDYLSLFTSISICMIVRKSLWTQFMTCVYTISTYTNKLSIISSKISLYQNGSNLFYLLI
jgi:hypothetical protein